jgi:uncharacterized protein YjbI with pentapeptide repeats
MDVDLTDAIVVGARFGLTTSQGFSEAQLASTASYQAKDLRGIYLTSNNLTGWDLREQNLTNAFLSPSTLTDVNLTGTILKNANLERANLSSAIVDTTTVYNQWTVFPPEFNPTEAGLRVSVSPPGDLDGDDSLMAADVDILAIKIRIDDLYLSSHLKTWWLPDAAFDLNADEIVSLADHRTWVKDVADTWYGDANLDGEFTSDDFVQVFEAGKCEQGWVDAYGDIQNDAGWAQGDWNADGVFDSADFVTAFIDGGYELGPRTDPAAIPEPGGWLLWATGLPVWLSHRRASRRL